MTRAPAPLLGIALAVLACDAARGPVFAWGTGNPSCGGGLACGLKGEYFQMPSYEGRAFNGGSLAFTRVDPQISFDWGTGGPDPRLPGPAFMVRWTGYLHVPAAAAAPGQSYRFTLRADDGVRLWVDERLIVDDWNDHQVREDAGDILLVGGATVPLKLEYYQHLGTASIALGWAPAGQTPAPIPAAALAPPGEGNGLLASYFAGQSFDLPALSRVDQDIAFHWGLDAPDAAVPADRFSARWTGTVEPRYSEVYTFTVRVAETNEGTRLLVNDAPVIDAWIAPSALVSQGTVALEAGRRYPLTLEYFETIGGAAVELLWASPSQPETRVAWNRLRPPP